MGVLIEGFDPYEATNGGAGETSMVGAGWTMGGDLRNEPCVGSAYSRFGVGQGMRQGDSTGSGNTRTLVNGAVSHADFAFSVSVRFNQTTGYIGLCDSAGARQVTVSPAANNTVTLFGNNTTLYTSGVNAAVLGDWHTYRIIGKIAASGGWLDFYIDADLVYQVSGVDTQTTANANVSGFITQSNNNQGDPIYVDDMVLLTGADAANGIPECRISVLTPNSDGSTLDLTPSTGSDHYAVVDEAIFSTTDYLYGTGDGEMDLLNLADLSYPPDQIVAVQARMLANKMDIASRKALLGMQVGSTSSDGVAANLTTSATQKIRGWSLNPDTGLAWDKAGVDSIQLYPKIIFP